jgi:hypothetical protein
MPHLNHLAHQWRVVDGGSTRLHSKAINPSHAYNRNGKYSIPKMSTWFESRVRDQSCGFMLSYWTATLKTSPEVLGRLHMRWHPLAHISTRESCGPPGGAGTSPRSEAKASVGAVLDTARGESLRPPQILAVCWLLAGSGFKTAKHFVHVMSMMR